MSNAKQERDAELLANKARSLHEEARTVMACSLAIEAGEMDVGEANELISTQRMGSSLDVVQSDAYPGDEWYDRADEELSPY